MTRLTLDISMSLDGFVAGPNATLDAPLGENGELLHEWVITLRSWREEHGKSGVRPASMMTWLPSTLLQPAP